MVKIYGASDDLVEIEGSNYAEDEIGCFEKDVLITFVDGTVIRVGYPRDRYGTWWIIVEEYGSNPVFHQTIVTEESENGYSDIFETENEIKSHAVVEQKYPNGLTY